MFCVCKKTSYEKIAALFLLAISYGCNDVDDKALVCLPAVNKTAMTFSYED